jgi:hypothetical protein
MKPPRKPPETEKLYPTRHVTIGAVMDAGLRIHAFCLDCGHDEDLDLGEVARRLGRGFPSLPAHLVPRLVCSSCGSKNVGTVLAPEGREVPGQQLVEIRKEWQRREPPADPIKN